MPGPTAWIQRTASQWVWFGLLVGTEHVVTNMCRRPNSVTPGHACTKTKILSVHQQNQNKQKQGKSILGGYLSESLKDVVVIIFDNSNNNSNNNFENIWRHFIVMFDVNTIGNFHFAIIVFALRWSFMLICDWNSAVRCAVWASKIVCKMATHGHRTRSLRGRCGL